MINNFKKLFSAITFALVVLLANVNIFAADPVYVTINGEPIVYEDAQPQIMNQRAMVPIRKTAESLGATLEWNKTTETMTITKGDRTVVHTMRSAVITVNGTALTFDTPSAVVQDRTMMPVRMLSEALGNIVNWDNSTRTVNIIVTDEPTIVSVVPDKTTVDNGEEVNIAITANSVTDRVRIVDIDNQNEVVAESNAYSINSDGNRVFSIPWTPSVSKSTFKTLKVLAGDSSTYNESSSSYKVCAISVNEDLSPKITYFASNETEVSRGTTIKLTIETNAYTDRVKIENDEGTKLAELTNYTLKNTSDTSVRVFTVSLEMSTRGDIQLRAYAGTSTSYQSNYEKITINVGGAGSSTSTSLNINDAYFLDDTVYLNEKAKIVVETSTDIVKIEIADEDDKILDSTKYPTIKNASEYIWELDVTASSSGRNKFYITAYDSNGAKTTETLSISVSTYSNSDLNILSIEQKDLGASSGDTVKFIIRTTGKAQSIKILEDGYEIASQSSYSNDGSVREWEVKIKVTSSNKDYLKVVAYDSNSNQVSKRINVYLNAKLQGKIYDYELKTTEVYQNEYIRLNVYTNKAIKKVWVEDYNDVRVLLKTEYDSVSGDEYTWELKFAAEDVGTNLRYTIYAEDEDGKVYEQIFRVSVNKG